MSDPQAVTRGARKVREGTVVSARMQKTVVVAVVDRVRHPKYQTTRPTTRRSVTACGSWRRDRCPG